jgi:hypothetical protein
LKPTAFFLAIKPPAPLFLASCHHAIREMLFGAIACLPSIPHKLLRTPALVEPTEFSLEFLADFRPRGDGES